MYKGVGQSIQPSLLPYPYTGYTRISEPTIRIICVPHQLQHARPKFQIAGYPKQKRFKLPTTFFLSRAKLNTPVCVISLLQKSNKSYKFGWTSPVSSVIVVVVFQVK